MTVNMKGRRQTSIQKNEVRINTEVFCLIHSIKDIRKNLS